MSRKIKTLLFSTLYPSVARPMHGIFVETRLRELLKSGEVETKVVAPVPWFPFSNDVFKEYGKFAATPKFEHRNGVDVHHPRYFLPPKVGMGISPYALGHGAISCVRGIIEQGFDFDLIDAHYYYPDGVAAAIIARTFGKPFVVTARGSDINLITTYNRPRRLVLETTKHAYASIGVSRALIDRLADLGADSSKLHVMRNGVDLERFHQIDKVVAREYLRLPLKGRLLLSVGHLVELKGHHIAIDALVNLPLDVSLIIVGSGPELERLEALARERRLTDRVHFVGQIPNADLKWWYSAADALVLCSSREGWANVLLEAMACGTPAIATNIGGTPDIINNQTAGRLMIERTPRALVSAFSDLFSNQPDADAVRIFAESFSWEATTNAQIRLFSGVSNA